MSAATLAPAGSVKRTRFSLPARTPSGKEAGGASVATVAGAVIGKPLSRSTEVYQAPGHGDGVGEAGGPGLALAGETKRGAVVGARAHKRQPEGDVHGFIEIDRLQRGEALVVIERDDDVEFAAQRSREQRVARLAARKAGKLGADFFQGGIDKVDLLVTEEPALPRVRVEP